GNGNNNLVENNEECVVEQTESEEVIDNFVESDYALGKDNIRSWWLDQTNDPTDTSVKACWLSESIQYGDDKLYQQRKRMEDLEKETKGFTHVVS
ncbi:hypothetical protein Tco_0437273, partial [Tanacetum coccineum]